jgi:hypothetical protein
MSIFNLTENSTYYAEIWGFDGTRWNGAAMVAPSTIASADWAAGMAALVELSSSDSSHIGVYAFTAPTALPAGGYLLAVHSTNSFEAIANAVALSEFIWSGSAEAKNSREVVEAAAVNAVKIGGAQQTAKDFGAVAPDNKPNVDANGNMRAVDSSGNSIAPAATALSNATWTDSRAGYLDALNGIAANIASAVWSATSRTLSAFGVDVTLAANQHVIVDSGVVTSVTDPVTVGTNNDKSGYSFDGVSLATATEASVDIKDIPFNAFRDASATLYAHVYNNGNDIQRADVSSLVYSIYLLDESDKNARTAVEGHSNASLVVANVISDTVQTDGVETGYNFKHTPLVADHPAFTIAGRHYLVEYVITLTTNEPILVRFKVNVL